MNPARRNPPTVNTPPMPATTGRILFDCDAEGEVLPRR